MIASKNINEDLMDRWVVSDQTVRLAGLDLKPIPHPMLTNSVQCVVKGQGTVFFLRQHPHGNIWLLKKFAPSRRPSDNYLEAVTQTLPGGASFFTCTQRHLLTPSHLDWFCSRFRDPDLGTWLEGTLLMPKVPGSSWAAMADGLRTAELDLSIKQRLQVGLNLADCIARLEAAGCCHRDLSSSNVFLVPAGQTYLIDWDCLYHAALPYQANTSAGTMGYIAPFMRVSSSSDWEASRSWCPCADRFALAILIAEFLLIGRDSPLHEDGTLFSQAQIDDSSNKFVTEQINALRNLSKRCGSLLEQAFYTVAFDTCPSPSEWYGALRHELHAFSRQSVSVTVRRSSSRCICTGCSTPFWINSGKLGELEQRGKRVLCKRCFKMQLQQWRIAQLERARAYPEIACEHCQKTFPIPRAKLDQLRCRAKPILCSSCLHEQLRRWDAERSERERSFPLTRCSGCDKRFRLRREKLETLQAAAKAILCPPCLATALGR